MISIIIPTLNEEKVLESTLTALKKCSTISYEIIVSDGGSTDRTVEIAKKYADIVVEHTDTHRQTIAEGRNEGAARARGEVLVFIDADVFIPDIDAFFSKAMQYFSDPKLAAITVRLKVFPDMVTLGDRIVWGIMNTIHIVQNNVFHLGIAAGDFQMIRTRSFDTVGGYNSTLVAGEDNELFYRLSKVGKTRVAANLYVFHTSRRAHTVGWPRLVFLWMRNGWYVKVKKKAFDTEWKVIR